MSPENRDVVAKVVVDAARSCCGRATRMRVRRVGRI